MKVEGQKSPQELSNQNRGRGPGECHHLRPFLGPRCTDLPVSRPASSTGVSWGSGELVGILCNRTLRGMEG